MISAETKLPMAWAEINSPVNPAPTRKWSRATTGNSASTLKARAFMIRVIMSTARITGLSQE